jgi:GNAT superfamily N-acetyltransferase
MGVRFRLMTADDIPEGMRMKEVAGWNQTAADWMRFLTATPDGCFVAECEGQVVGTSATIIHEGRVAWIGMVLVDAPYRGRGIGTALLERAIRYLESRNVPSMKLDATPQGKPLYRKLGFVSEYEIERWMLKRQSAVDLPVKGTIEIEDVLRLDREIFGADRRQLLRSLAEAAPDFALVERQGEEITGYTFGRRGSRADHLGPWVARSEDAASRLLDAFLRRSDRDLVFVDCIQFNPWAIPLVKARCFQFSRPLTRMFRGTNKYAGRPELVCGVLGPELG